MKLQSDKVHKYWRGVYWNLFATIFRAVISIGSSVIFLRYLGDTGYGAVIVMADFITISIVFLSQGLGVVQTRELPKLLSRANYGEAKALIYKLFFIRIGLSLVFGCLFLINKEVIHSSLFKTIDVDLFIIAILLVPVQIISICFKGALEVTYHQKNVVIGDTSSLVLRLLLAAPVIVFDLGIVCFYLTQLFVDIFLVLYYGYYFYIRVWLTIQPHKKKNYHGRIWSSGLLMMVVMVANKFLGKEMDIQILSFRLGEAGLTEVAVYSISYMLVMRCLSFVGVGVGGMSNLTQAILSEFKASNDFGSIRNIYTSQIQLFYFVAIPFIFGGVLTSERILSFLYGDLFTGRGAISCALIFVLFGFVILNQINYVVLFSFGLEKRMVVVRLGFGILNLILSMILSRWGAMGVAFATLVSLFGISFYETIIVRKLIAPKYPFIFLFKVTFGSLLMALFILMFNYTTKIDSDLINISILLPVSIAVFFGCMVLLKPFGYDAIKKSSSVNGSLKNILLRFAI